MPGQGPSSDAVRAASTIGEELSQNVRTRFYIGGEWVRSHSAQWIKVVDPTTEEALLELPLADRTDVDRAIAKWAEQAVEVAEDIGQPEAIAVAARSQAYLITFSANRANLEDERRAIRRARPSSALPESAMIIDGVNVHKSITADRILVAVEASRTTLDDPGYDEIILARKGRASARSGTPRFSLHAKS